MLGKFTKDKVHKGISYFFVLILLFKNLLYYPFSGSLTFAESDVLFVTFGLGLVLLGINLYFKYKKQEENEYDMILVNALNLLALVPIIMTITNDLISNEAAFIMASVMALFIGYRWLIIIEPLKMKNEKHFVLGVNIGILLLTFSLNLFYFDHDFSQFKDVLKFFLLFLVNVYNVWSLREIYKGYCKTDHVERNFIILYGIGVLIHSIFIHRYINFEFDKVILSSYFLIASAVGILAGFRQGWSVTRRIGLGAIYFSLAKFFIYDFFNQDFSNFVKMVTYFILGFILLGISYLYAYLEKTYGYKEHPNTNEKKESKYSVKL